MNKMKYRNTILYLIKSIGEKELEGKKRLCKLLYFVDFAAYEKYEQPITGDTYIRLPMGPKPDNFDEIMDLMIEKDEVSVKEELRSSEHQHSTIIYELKKDPDVNSITEKEKQVIDWVIEKYGKLTGKELEDISHNEAPWLAVKENGETIPYELSHYRRTVFGF